MKFSIVTPTYKRAGKLIHCVNSVLSQSYTDFEIIIINDSPDDLSYADFEKDAPNIGIKYFKNKKNMGVNYSRNFALENLSPDSDFVIFLDDDDWFANDTLSNFEKLIKENPDENWFITNRVYESGKSLTSAPKNNTRYNYTLDYLIGKRIKGDATHCIKTAETRNIYFSKTVKQGEEWFFFYQLGLKNKIFYHSHNSTISEGYDTSNGLNFRKRSHSEYFNTIIKLAHEGFSHGLLIHPTFFIYMMIRLILSIFK